jgi:hypothetical protein
MEVAALVEQKRRGEKLTATDTAEGAMTATKEEDD